MVIPAKARAHPAVRIEPGRLLAILLLVDSGLLVAYVLGRLFLWSVDDPGPVRIQIARLVDLAGEPAIPTWFAIAQLLTAASLLAWIGLRTRLEERRAFGWFGLAVVVAYLSIDEQAGIHETLVEPVRALFGITTGPLLLAWVIPALAAVAVVALVSIGFMRRLPRLTRRRMIVAAVVYLAGTVGMEMVDSSTFEIFQSLGTAGQRIKYALYGLEEALELVGVSILIWALLRHLADTVWAVGQPIVLTSRR